jgi:NAD(P)-dependent dehydrogenase (short-subunit alcohol dehydrogenase family)
MTRGTVLVTGTSSGIGRATALHLACLGFDVLAGVRSGADGEAVRALSPDRISPVVLDVTDAAQISTAIELASRTGLAGLVNNAGVTVQGPVEHLSIDDFRRQLEINLVGPVALTKAAIPLLRASRGRIVMLSSIGGRMALPFVSPYHASKFALEGFSDSLRMELRPLGVDVSVIEPGSVKTEIWRKGAEAGRAALDALPPAARALYGKRLEGMLATADKTAARGVEPVDVAEAVADALTARRPKARYVVGPDARAQVVMRSVLPTRVMDSVTARLTATR